MMSLASEHTPDPARRNRIAHADELPRKRLNPTIVAATATTDIRVFTRFTV
jgi:hypothetical protein